LKHTNNNKGLSMVECLIALILTTVTVVSLVSMQSLAWRGAAAMKPNRAEAFLAALPVAGAALVELGRLQAALGAGVSTYRAVWWRKRPST